MVGIVYILTNEAMPGYVKVGKTRSQLLVRVRALDNTSTPLPFDCFYAAKVSDPDVVERLLHDAFADRRTRKNREFFEISPERIASALKLAAIEEVKLFEDIAETEEDAAAVKKARSRRDRFNFKMVDIAPGFVLHHSKDDQITCVVAGANTVDFEGQEMSLSKAALLAFNRLGYNWSAVSGPESWLYNGATLDELRREAEASD